MGYERQADFGTPEVKSDTAVTLTIDGREVALDIAYSLGLGSGTTIPGDFDDLLDVNYTIDATVKGDQMEGRCAMKVMGIGLGADIVLERI